MDFTFLTVDEIFGDKALDVIKKHGREVAPTDLAVILGGIMSSYFRTSEGDLTCSSWSASSDVNDRVSCVYCKGDEHWHPTNGRQVSARPVLSSSEDLKSARATRGSESMVSKLRNMESTHKRLRMNSSAKD